MYRASVITLAALAMVACKPKTKAVTTSPESRQRPGVEIAVPPATPDAGAPLAGPPGNDALGFPLQYVDRVALRRMLARGSSRS